MVIVAVTDDHGIHGSKIHSQTAGILPGDLGSTGIKEQMVVFRFDIKTQPVLRDALRHAPGIVHEIDDSHGLTLLRVLVFFFCYYTEPGFPCTREQMLQSDNLSNEIPLEYRNALIV